MVDKDTAEWINKAEKRRELANKAFECGFYVLAVVALTLVVHMMLTSL